MTIASIFIVSEFNRTAVAKKRDPSNALKRNATEAYRVDATVKLIASRITKCEPRCHAKIAPL